MRKELIIMGTVAMLGFLLTGCADNAGGTTAAAGETNAAAANEEQEDGSGGAGEKIFHWSSANTISNINPMESSTNSEIVLYVQSRLYRYVINETRDAPVLAPDLAAGEPETEDGYTWTIAIDPEAKWANGDPINADTFLYSWEMALDPKVSYASASGLAKNYIEVVNAYEYYTQESTGVPVAWEDVGFKKVDDYTVSVTTTEKYSATDVMRHFQMSYTGPVYEPLYEAGMNADRTATTYGTEVDQMMSCGPFELVSWTKGTERVFEKNENYLHADEVLLDGMDVRVVQDELTRLELFEKGELDYLALGSNGEEKYGDDPRTYIYESGVVRSIEMNFENPDKPYLNNLNFRKALYYGIDRESIAELTGNIPADYFIPTSYDIYADGTAFRELPGVNDYLGENSSYDPEAAKQYFDLALEETGVDKVSLNLIYNEAVEDLRAASETIQSSLTELFGADRFELSISAMNNSAAIELMRTSQNGPTNGWDMCWGAWDLTAAIFYPNRKFEVYTSNDSRRFSQYNDKVLDELYEESISEECRLDEVKRGELVMEMEKELLGQVLEVPVFQGISRYIFSEDMIVPVDEYCNVIGFGFSYMDKAQ